jgi:AcrR family transcriptional regulator
MSRKRQSIIAAGRRIFLSQGILNTRMEQIADAVPVSKMTLYNIFGNKEGLLEAVVDEMIKEGTSLFESALSEAQDPLDALNRLSSLDGIEAEMTEIFMKDLMTGYPALMQRLMEAGTRHVLPKFQQLILEGQQQGQIRRDLSPIVVVSFLKFIKEYISRTDLLSAMGPPQMVGEQLASIFYHGILADKSSE